MNYQKLLTLIFLLTIFIIIAVGIEGENIKIKAQTDLKSVTPVSIFRIEAAIDWAENWKENNMGSIDYNEECLRFVQDAYEKGAGLPLYRYAYATLAGEKTKAKENKYEKIPRGALVYFDWTGEVEGEIRNWGHVGLALGEGQMIHAHGTVKKGSIEKLNKIKGYDYIGWAWPDFIKIKAPGANTRSESISVLTPTFYWEEVKGANSYAFAIRDLTVDKIVYNPQELTGTSHVIPKNILNKGNKYMWNMQAIGDSGKESSLSNTLYFKIEAKSDLDNKTRPNFDFDKDTGTILDYNIEGGSDVIIPSKIDGVIVKVIGDAAFRDKKLSSVKIPDSVLEIERSAFSSNNLKSVVIPASVEKIGMSAFTNNNLRKININNSNVNFIKYAFPEGFKEVYEKNNKFAGSYIYKNNEWVIQSDILEIEDLDVKNNNFDKNSENNVVEQEVNLEINAENVPSVLQRGKTIEFNLNVTNTSELKFEEDLSLEFFLRRVKDSNTYASYEIEKSVTKIDKGEQKLFEIKLKIDSELPLEKPVEKYQLSIALVNKKEILDSILIDFDLFKGPYIEKIEPLYAGVGDEVKIIGKNFPTDEEFWVDISIPGLTGEILSKSSNEIKFIVPEPNFVLETKEDRQQKVFLRERTVMNPWRSNEVHFVFARPHINFIHPEKGTPESKIEIVGKHFGGTNEPEVRFGETVLEAHNSPPVPLGKSGKVISWQEDKLIVSPPKDYGTGISAIEDAYSLINTVMEGPSEFIEGEAKDKYYKRIFELLGIENLEIDIEKVSYLELFRKMALAMSVPGLDLQTTGEIDVPVVIKTKMGKSNSIIFHYTNILNPGVAVVMDVSGSMNSQSKLGNAKKAIKSFIDSQNEEYYLSLASYSTSAKSIVNPVSIVGGKDELRRGIDYLSASGNTNIGSGLRVGLNQLSLNNKLENSRMILLSDGKHNTGKLWPVVEECSKKRIKVDTVAFGSDADYDTLYKIANMTGGRALKAGNKNLSYIYHRISNQIQNYSTLFASKDFIKSGQELNYLVNVDPGIETLKFYTNWQGSRILMEFTDPDGNKITPDKNSARYIKEETYNIYEIEAKPGQWEMNIIGRDLPAQGEQVNISVSGKSKFYTNFLTFQPEYSPGSKVMIGIEVDKVKGLNRIPLKNVKVNVKIHKPSVAIAKKSGNKIEISLGGLLKAATQKKEVEISLHDDGNHNDYRDNDGIFANLFSETDEKGPYLVTGVIEGELEDGQKIKRKIFETFQVGPIDENKLTTSQMTEEILKSFIPFK